MAVEATVRGRVANELSSLIVSLGPQAVAAHWYFFGSAERGVKDAADIDVLLICESDAHADLLRRMIDPDSLSLPLHLSLMTLEEAEATDAIHTQRAIRIFPVAD